MSGAAGGDARRAMAERTTILRAPCGSNLHGLALPGKDDRDEMGVCVEDIDAAIGFAPFEQYIYRTAAERTGKHDAPSEPGDLDLTVYSLRKFLRLAMQGNPQLIQLLFVPDALCETVTVFGAELRTLVPAIVSRRAGARYLGYFEAQKHRLLGERGQKKTNRPDLEAAHGYDTKYAMHMLRLGFQGVELLSTGRLTLPMPEADRAFVFAVRKGEVPIQDATTKAGILEQQIRDLMTDGPLREEPEVAQIEEWMCDTYMQAWDMRGGT